MSDTYTPTMNDVKHWLCEPPYAGGLFDDETAAKFDVALAAHDAEVAAKALEEAADLAEGVECIVLDPVMEKIGKNVGLSLAQELRARAAEYRKAVE